MSVGFLFYLVLHNKSDNYLNCLWQNAILMYCLLGFEPVLKLIKKTRQE
jgi:hypothetical protein